MWDGCWTDLDNFVTMLDKAGMQYTRHNRKSKNYETSITVDGIYFTWLFDNKGDLINPEVEIDKMLKTSF